MQAISSDNTGRSQVVQLSDQYISNKRLKGTDMSFQAYLDNIHAKTGNTPEQLKALATTAGVYKTDMKAGDLVAWLKKEFDLGHGHSMAIWKYFTYKGWVSASKKTK